MLRDQTLSLRHAGEAKRKQIVESFNKARLQLEKEGQRATPQDIVQHLAKVGVSDDIRAEFEKVAASEQARMSERPGTGTGTGSGSPRAKSPVPPAKPRPESAAPAGVQSRGLDFSQMSTGSASGSAAGSARVGGAGSSTVSRRARSASAARSTAPSAAKSAQRKPAGAAAVAGASAGKPGSRVDAEVSVAQLQSAQNAYLLQVLEREQAAETERGRVLDSVTDDTERRRLNKIFEVERARAAEGIRSITIRHEQVCSWRALIVFLHLLLTPACVGVCTRVDRS
jgi:hypothetical protein